MASSPQDSIPASSNDALSETNVCSGDCDGCVLCEASAVGTVLNNPDRIGITLDTEYHDSTPAGPEEPLTSENPVEDAGEDYPPLVKHSDNWQSIMEKILEVVTSHNVPLPSPLTSDSFEQMLDFMKYFINIVNMQWRRGCERWSSNKVDQDLTDLVTSVEKRGRVLSQDNPSLGCNAQ